MPRWGDDARRVYGWASVRETLRGKCLKSPAYRTVTVPAPTPRMREGSLSATVKRPRVTAVALRVFNMRPRTFAANCTVTRPVALADRVPVTLRAVRESFAPVIDKLVAARGAGVGAGVTVLVGGGGGLRRRRRRRDDDRDNRTGRPR